MSNDDFVPPSQLPDHRIREIWAAVVVDPADNSEGFLQCLAIAEGSTRPQMTPVIGSDEYRLRSMRKMLPELARKHGLRITLVHFTAREDLETFEP